VNTLINVFADVALRDCLAVPISEEEEVEVVQSTLAQQIARQESHIKEQAGKIEALKTQLDLLHMDYRQKTETQEMVKTQTAIAQHEAEMRAEEAEARAKELELTIQRVDRERTKYSCRFRLLLGLSIVLIATLAIIFLPPSLSWTWLLNHPNKLGLQWTAAACVAGLTWALLETDKTRRNGAFLTLFLGALLVVGQILGK
jgi:hypothetical protein